VLGTVSHGIMGSFLTMLTYGQVKARYISQSQRVIPLRVEAEEGKLDSQVVECLAALVEKGEGIERDPVC